MATTVSAPEVRPQEGSRLRKWSARLEAWLERTGDRLNPILVKECRQALKGRQFTITFALVLLCCWIWSIWGMLAVGPGAAFGATSAGRDMFVGYFAILAFPLLVIVPHGAFRSLVDERDDRTFDLLAITTLSPRQIVAGKLGSAAVQAIVYLSAVSPCLAFTYLLRGIDAPTIFIALAYTSLLSMGLSVLGVLAGTLASERAWQMIWSVFVILGLIGMFVFAMEFAAEVLLRQRMGFDSPDFWIANAMMLLGYLSYFALFFLAAAARLTFVGENRSTALRIVMFVQPILLVFCIGWELARSRDQFFSFSVQLADAAAAAATYFLFVAVHWYVMGAMMLGETPRLSNRAKRRLPQSFLGRMCLSWFSPGPGTGYLFAISNMAAALLLAMATTSYASLSRSSWSIPMSFPPPINYDLLETCYFLFSYVAFYLGIGKLLLGFLRRFTSTGIVLAVMIQVLAVATGCMVPRVIEVLESPHIYQYSLLYTFDPFATMFDDRGAGAGLRPVALMLVGISALIVFVANVPSVVREISQVRVAKPARVAEEDAALEAQPVVVPRSPWDD